MGQELTVAAVQMYCNRSREENLAAAEGWIRQAAGDGAQVILLPELFETWYFCQERNYDSYRLAMTVWENPAVCRLRQVAAQLKVVLPVSFFERAGNVTYNSVAMIDADGELKGVYRKTHIPDDHFYQEKFYFTPGNTGFQVWDTAYGKIGLGICWDQWYPEAAHVAHGPVHGPDGGADPALSHGHRLRAHHRVRQHAPLAALHAGPRRGQCGAGSCG